VELHPAAAVLQRLVAGISGISGGTSGTGSTTGSGTTGSSGTSGGGGPDPLPTIQSVSVDTNGNLVVNGSPFLLIQGTNLDYRGWFTSGYTQSQADAKIAQMRQNGMNTIFADWYTMDTLWAGGNPTQYADLLVWQRHGLYIHGSATLDDTRQNNSGGVIADYGVPNNSDILQIMNRFKSRPNLLLWWINNEYNYDASLPAKYCTGANTVKGVDPMRTWGDVGVNSMTAAQWEQVLGACMPVTWVEATIAPFSTGEAVIHLYDGLAVLNQAWNDGTRFVLGFSTTPIPELDPAAVGDGRDCGTFYSAMRVPTQAEIHRYFMYQVANNVRAFDILWGPNQRCSNVPPGDSLAPAYLSAWNNTMTETNRVRSLAPIILAPGRWQPLVTTPAFVPYAPSPTGNDFRGIYAAKKTVGGTTYIIACNLDFVAGATTTSPWVENAVKKATINVGFPIKSATRIFETGAASFSGGVITDAFAPMGVHVYVVTPQ